VKTVQIICPHNLAGLTRDRDIIKSILEPHFEVTLSDSDAIKKEAFDIDIHVEHLVEINPKSKYKIIIPNPEWFEIQWTESLKYIDLVLAKTRDCESIFKRLHPNVRFTSFTSVDRYLPDVEKKNQFFHSCGKSQSKGTKEVLDLWGKFRRPPYPKLQFYARPEMIEYGFFRKTNFLNVDTHLDFIPEKEFKIAQNENLIHICTSIYEGFGHYINEAKSCGCVVITTDAAPMNELVDLDFGLLSRCLPFSKMRLARTFRVSDKHLRLTVDQVESMPDDVLIELGQKARQSFLANDKFFKDRFLNIINKFS